MNILLKKLPFCVTSILISCGGGSGDFTPSQTGAQSNTSSTPSTSSFRGVAMDGYLDKARAFLDLNGNGLYDAGEPSAITDSKGAFALEATQDQINKYSVNVSAIAGTTIDQDSPGTVLTSGFTMMSPVGYPSVVSPLTTHVAAKMASGMSLSIAKNTVQGELGLYSVDVMKNFIAEKKSNPAYDEAHKIASAVTEVLKSVDSQSNSVTSLSDKLSTLSTKITTHITPKFDQIKYSASITEAKNITITGISNYKTSSVYDLIGTISSLTKDGLIISNGTDNLNIQANEISFIFKNKLAINETFDVIIKTQPNGQFCSLSNNAGAFDSKTFKPINIVCANS
ncbi:MAG: hypothetical protein WCO72_12095 [Betaproteobacteria bacterium]